MIALRIFSLVTNVWINDRSQSQLSESESKIFGVDKIQYKENMVSGILQDIKANRRIVGDPKRIQICYRQQYGLFAKRTKTNIKLSKSRFFPFFKDIFRCPDFLVKFLIFSKSSMKSLIIGVVRSTKTRIFLCG